jgi:predicted dehydrogenase
MRYLRQYKNLTECRRTMMSKNYKVGIIGCGGIAKSHAAGYAGNGLTVCALTDVNAEAMDKLAENIENEVTKYDDYKALIDSGTVDLVSICTPPLFHEEAAVYALQKGVHVLCEKPLASTLESAYSIKRVAAECSAVFMAAFRHRFLPAIQTMKQMIDDGAIDEPVLFQNVFCGPNFAMKDRWFCNKKIAGGGCMLDTSSHSVDLFRYLIGEVAEQKAVTHQHFENTDVEDVAILTLKAENGALATMGSGFAVGAGMAFIDITGKGGRLVYDYLKPNEIRYTKLGEAEEQIIETRASAGFEEQIAHFVSVINNEDELLVGIDDAVRCQEIIQSA